MKRPKKINCSAITAAVWNVAEAIGEPICAGADVANIMDGLSTMDRESFWILTLDQKHRVIGRHMISLGSLTASIVHPREVFKVAIIESAAAIILCHNHPSGDTVPSKEDNTLTDRLVQAGRILGIRTLDHIIIGRNKSGGVAWTSLREYGCSFD